MSLDGKMLTRAIERYEQQKERRTRETARLRQRIYEQNPRIEELDRLLIQTAADAVVAAVDQSGDPERALAALRDKNMALQAERAELISMLGYSMGCIDELPKCKKCSDRGFIGNKPCECLMSIYADEQKKELSSLLNLNEESFENFKLEYYDEHVNGSGITPRKHMSMVYRSCLSYAEKFNRNGENIFLSGGTGLGKTFLSSCIAGRVSKMGYSVVYDTAVNLIARFEESRFNKSTESENADADVRRYLNCDLLILDDLGTELITTFSISVIYSVINSRLRSRKNMVISSNLSAEEIQKKYSPQIASRIDGEFMLLNFYGKDIRLLKNNKS